MSYLRAACNNSCSSSVSVLPRGNIDDDDDDDDDDGTSDGIEPTPARNSASTENWARTVDVVDVDVVVDEDVVVVGEDDVAVAAWNRCI